MPFAHVHSVNILTNVGVTMPRLEQRTTKYLLTIVVSAIALTGCVSFRDLTPHLIEAVGKTPDQMSYPPLSRIVGTKDHGVFQTIQYSFSGTGNCRWEFDIDVQSRRIQSWRYPDTTAESYCRSLAATRP